MYKIIYHQVKPGVDCPDGIAAAVVAYKAITEWEWRQDRAQMIGWVYQSESFPPIEPGDHIVIVDFSFPASVLEQWADMGCSVTVIDHHETAMNNLVNLSDRIDSKFDMTECGATMTWKHFHLGEPVPPILQYVRDRDLWDFLLPYSQEVHEAVSTLRYNSVKYHQCEIPGLTPQQSTVVRLFNALLPLCEEDLLAILVPIGAPLLAPKYEKIKAAAARMQWEDVAGHNVPVVRLNPDGSEDRLVSDLCMYLYRSIPEAPFVACITSDGSYSLRSDKHGNNTDVGEIAESQGGGGHHNAAGFRPVSNS